MHHRGNRVRGYAVVSVRFKSIGLKGMKKTWVAILLVLSLLSGCVVPEGGLGSSVPDYQYNPSTGSYVPVAEAAYYDQPLYSYGNVNYYYVSGRYMYDDGYGPTYVDRLPYGGYYNRSHPVYPCRTSASIVYARSRPISSAPVLSVTNKVVVNKTYVQQTNIQQTNINQVNMGSSSRGETVSRPGSLSSRTGSPSQGGGSAWGGRTSTGGYFAGSSAPSATSSRGSAPKDAFNRDTRPAPEPSGLFSKGSSSSGSMVSRGVVPSQGAAPKPSYWGGSSARPSTVGGGLVRPTTTTGVFAPKKEVSGGSSSRPPMTTPTTAPRVSPAPAAPSASPAKKKPSGSKPDQP